MKQLPIELKRIQEMDPWRRGNSLHWLVQQKLEQSRTKRGLPVDTVRRYRYHLLPETPMQIIHFLYGEKVAELCKDLVWDGAHSVIEEGCPDADTATWSRRESLDRWESFYREKDYAFVAKEYRSYPPEVIDAVFDLCLFSLRDDRLDERKLVRLKDAVSILTSLPYGKDDFRIGNLISAGNETLEYNEKLKRDEQATIETERPEKEHSSEPACP